MPPKLPIMKSFILISLISLTLSTPAYTEEFKDKNNEKDSWIYKLKEKAEDKISDAIESSVNDWFSGNVWDILGEKIGEKIGEAFAKNLAGFITLGPFLSIDSLFGGGSASESQAMTKILLEAIEASKKEIINAVEQSFQDETEADLNALILTLNIYNARAIEYRQREYRTLFNMSQLAARVKKRLEQRTSKVFDNLHLYMTVSALHIEIEKQYGHWLALDLLPEITPQEIEAEYRRVIKVALTDNVNHLTGPYIGSINQWKNSFKSDFSDYVTYAGEIPSNEYLASKYDRKLSMYLSYNMNDKPVKFKVLRLKGGAGCIPIRVGSGTKTSTQYHALFDVYDATDTFVTTSRTTYLNNLICTKTPHEYDNVRKTIVGTGKSEYKKVIELHKNDEKAFLTYLNEGYIPVKDMIDTWWKLTGNTQRSQSEVDRLIDPPPTPIGSTPPSVCPNSGRLYATNVPAQSMSGTMMGANSFCGSCGTTVTLTGTTYTVRCK